jgi:hypothetical protein
LVAVAAALAEEAAAAKVREKHAAGEAPVLAPAASAPARRATQEKAVCILWPAARGQPAVMGP